MSKRRKDRLPPFVALSRRMLKQSEWRQLSSIAKIVYIYLKHKFVGGNNGDIVLHYSELSDLFAPATISKAFKELIGTGWVECTKYGGLYRYTNRYKLTGKYDEIILRYGF